MIITGLHIDGFGIWSGLRLDDVSEAANVFFGPNEAGKTTLMQFIRSVLYGFSSERGRYLPPLGEGRPGGRIEVADANGRFTIQRYAADGTLDGADELTITAADGTRQGPHLLKVLLGNLDEAVFNNIFAVGLRELQELGTLNDTEAAEMLYNLTTGLDRVSLADVTRELQAARERILAPGGGSSLLPQLFARREELRRELEDIGSLNGQVTRLATQCERLQRDLARRQGQVDELGRELRVVEIAASVRGPWQKRAGLDDQLAALGPLPPLPEGAVDRLDEINARLDKHGRAVEELKQRHEQIREEAAALAVNEELWRQSPRIEALADQQPWIETLDGRIAELAREAEELEEQLGARCEQLGLGPEADDEALTSALDRISLSSLRPPAAAIRRCRRDLEKAQRRAAEMRQNAESLGRQIETALAARGESDLTAAIERRSDLVARLRRRMQLDERIEQMQTHRDDLEEQSRELIQRQVMPAWILVGLGSVFALGVVLVLAGLVIPGLASGAAGWGLALLGLAGTGTAAGVKVMLERAGARRLEACQKQLEMLRLQIQQSQEDRRELDQRLPGDGASPAGRLAEAERELAAVEELLPLDARRQSAQGDAQEADGRMEAAKTQSAEARSRWRRVLAENGLPQNLAPKQLRTWLRSRGEIADLVRRLDRCREELGQRRREREAVAGRIAQLARDAGLDVYEDQPLATLRRLTDAVIEQGARVQRRDELRRQARKVRRLHARRQQAIERWTRSRRDLLRDADAEDEQQLRRRAVQHARAEMLRRDRDAVSREIALAVGTTCTEEEVAELLRSVGADDLSARRDQLKARLDESNQQLQADLEKRGELNEKLKTLAEDRQFGGKQLDLAVVEKRIDDAVHQWRVRAVTSHLLDSIRESYERERQPETLQEASGYLERMTEGRYARVWTPLGENALRVEDATGRSLGVELLSRGTREQLFLSLRLALAASFARRGAMLPIVLDDVLVNFDGDRAKAAAAVLRDFAAEGHQVLVFTCHEHVAKRFKSLRVSVNELPAREEPQADEETPTTKSKRKPSRKGAARRSKPEPVEPEEESPAAEEIPVPAKHTLPMAKESTEPDEDDFDDEEDVVWEEVDDEDDSESDEDVDEADEEDEDDYGEEDYDDEDDDGEDEEFDEEDDAEESDDADDDDWEEEDEGPSGAEAA